VGTETQLLNVIADCLDLLRRRLRFHDNQHDIPQTTSLSFGGVKGNAFG